MTLILDLTTQQWSEIGATEQDVGKSESWQRKAGKNRLWSWQRPPKEHLPAPRGPTYMPKKREIGDFFFDQL